MSVKVSQNARASFSATLDDFKNAFARTDQGGFKYSVSRTRGELYVSGVSLRSANTRGGRGTVTSTVKNSALRAALIKAFADRNASAAFMKKVYATLIPTGKKADAEAAVRRRDVRSLIDEFERSEPAALDDGLEGLAPKPLAKRDIRAADAGILRGLNTWRGLEKVCKRLETSSKTIRDFVKKYQTCIKPSYCKFLEDFAAVRSRMAKVGRDALVGKAGKVLDVKAEMKAVFDQFLQRHPGHAAGLSHLLYACDNRIVPDHTEDGYLYCLKYQDDKDLTNLLTEKGVGLLREFLSPPGTYFDDDSDFDDDSVGGDAPVGKNDDVSDHQSLLTAMKEYLLPELNDPEIRFLMRARKAEHVMKKFM